VDVSHYTVKKVESHLQMALPTEKGIDTMVPLRLIKVAPRFNSAGMRNRKLKEDSERNCEMIENGNRMEKQYVDDGNRERPLAACDRVRTNWDNRNMKKMMDDKTKEYDNFSNYYKENVKYGRNIDINDYCDSRNMVFSDNGKGEDFHGNWPRGESKYVDVGNWDSTSASWHLMYNDGNKSSYYPYCSETNWENRIFDTNMNIMNFDEQTTSIQNCPSPYDMASTTRHVEYPYKNGVLDMGFDQYQKGTIKPSFTYYLNNGIMDNGVMGNGFYQNHKESTKQDYYYYPSPESMETEFNDYR